MNMYRVLLYLFFIFPFTVWGVGSHYILVSVAPHRFFVEQIAGDTVRVGLMVPAGDSAHTYEPTPRQMMEACEADAWFVLGEQFEKRASARVRERNPGMYLVDLREGLDLIYDGCSCCCHDAADPHIWLSVRLAKRQAETIARTLSKLYPGNRELYSKNLMVFEEKLDRLDEEIRGLLGAGGGQTVVVGHPAYAYFCRDYGLKQISVESEGRDPSPQQLTRLIGELQEKKVQKVFTQPQYNDKGVKLIARQLGLKVVSVDPYSEDYFCAMQSIAQNFSQQ